MVSVVEAVVDQTGVPVDPVLDPVVDSVVEEDPALVDSVVDPQLLSQAPGRSEGDQKLRQSRKRNHGSSLFLLCLNFGPLKDMPGPSERMSTNTHMSIPSCIYVSIVPMPP